MNWFVWGGLGAAFLFFGWWANNQLKKAQKHEQILRQVEQDITEKLDLEHRSESIDKLRRNPTRASDS